VKGLVAGSIRITRKDKLTVDYSVEPEVSHALGVKLLKLMRGREFWFQTPKKLGTFSLLLFNGYW